MLACSGNPSERVTRAKDKQAPPEPWLMPEGWRQIEDVASPFPNARQSKMNVLPEEIEQAAISIRSTSEAILNRL